MSTVTSSRILIIDDEQFVANLLAMILTDRGHKVVKAASVEEALPLFESNEFDIVFTDLAMPQTDGITGAARIKERRPAIKVVLMSGYGAETTGDRDGKGVIDAAIAKPFDMAEIDRTIKSVLSAES
ncbi:MAG TPA: response regulator [Blastocatellia bacterium]|nr:response regulator [Blastocatellia bacterium]